MKHVKNILVLTALALLGTACSDIKTVMHTPATPFGMSNFDTTGREEVVSVVDEAQRVTTRHQAAIAEARKYATAVVDESNQEFRTAWAPEFPGAQYKANVTSNAKGEPVLGFSWSSPNVTYNNGSYLILTNDGRTSREIAAFGRLVNKAMKDIEAKVANAGIEVDVVATFYGQADGGHLPDNTKKYLGEYKTFTLPRATTTLNGQPVEKTYFPGMWLVNGDIALLRAVGLMREVMRDYPKEKLAHVLVEGKEVPQVGREHRMANLTLKLAARGASPGA